MEQALPAGCVDRCRGCAHRLLPEIESLHQKREFLEMSLNGLWAHSIAIEGPAPEARLHYRRKSTLAVLGQKIGMKIKAQSRLEDDEILEIPECPVHAFQINQVFAIIRETLLAHLPLVFVSQVGDLVGLVLKEKSTPERITEIQNRLAQSAFNRFPKIGVYLNFNPSAGNRIFFPKGWVHVFGAKDGEAELFGCKFVHGPSGFMQVHSGLYESAIRQVQAFFVSPAVIDLYSGLGISLWCWKKKAHHTIGVELSEESIRYAIKNGVTGILQGKSEERLPQLTQFLSAHSQVDLFCNPPRTGLEPFVVDWMVTHRSRIQRFAYLSCSPGTLSRDLKLLVEGGFKIDSINAYDFFPQTLHVEALVLLKSS
jgi:23S rRNA (uracil1939-C5)-methyltransferase